jgi:hypothetical protein
MEERISPGPTLVDVVACVSPSAFAVLHGRVNQHAVGKIGAAMRCKFDCAQGAELDGNAMRLRTRIVRDFVRLN